MCECVSEGSTSSLDGSREEVLAATPYGRASGSFTDMMLSGPGSSPWRQQRQEDQTQVKSKTLWKTA